MRVASPEAFAPLVAALAAFNARIEATEEAHTALRERVAQSFLRSLPPPPRLRHGYQPRMLRQRLSYAGVCVRSAWSMGTSGACSWRWYPRL